MKNLKIIFTSMAIIFATAVVAQDVDQNETAEETKMKTYTFYENGKKVKNSVKITTSMSQAVMTESEDHNQIDQTRVIPPKTVTKTVEIDKDADDAYDEVIKFNYISSSVKDFTLVSDNENLMVAVENGENLTILKDMTIAKENTNDPKKAHVFTDNNGKKVEFYVTSVNWNADENRNKSK